MNGGRGWDGQPRYTRYAFPPRLNGGVSRTRKMLAVNTLQAKSSLSRLVEAIEQGREREIIIARNGRPVAKGKFGVPDNIDAHNEDVARLFLGGERA